jgi:hypothetical protein
MGGGAAPFVDPSSISGLLLWCAADQLTGLNDGDAVASFTDLSGNDNHPVCANAANQPSFKTNILNSLPALLFSGDLDANGDWLRVGFAHPQPCMMFFIFKLLTMRVESLVIGNYLNAINIKAGTSSVNAIKAMAGTEDLYYRNSGVDEFAIWTVEFNGAASKIYKAGALVSTANAGTNAGDGVTIGASSSFALYGPGSSRELGNAHMYLAELIIYNKVLSAGERNNVGEFLSEKYGLNF